MAFQRANKREKDLSPDEALLKAERFCAYQERCPQEVRQKIKDLGMTGEAADQLYDVLETEGFFNAERFARAFAYGKLRSNHWGKVRIRMELRMRGIDHKLVEQTLAELSDELYTSILDSQLQKKLHQWADDPQGRQKAAAAMIRAGFESDLVFESLKNP